MKNKGKWTSLVTLLTFCLFAICMLLVLLTGAGSYRRLSENGGSAYARQTAAQYVSTRFHQGRDPQVQDFDGCEALVFSEEFGSQTYLTRIYYYDGFLMELFSAEAAGLEPEDGEKILAVSGFAAERQEDTFTVTVDGVALVLTCREGREAAYEE